MSLELIKEVKGRGVPVRGNDIDTDRIIPARFLKCVTFDGLGESAFADDIIALKEKGITHPFKDEAYVGASILISNSNFGCGSSREHAPQALKRWGIKSIIAESYSEIFFGNCVSLGIPCFKVSHSVASEILTWVESNSKKEIILSIENRSLIMDDKSFDLDIADGPRGQFMDGSWNATATLLANESKTKEVAASLPYMDF